MPSAEPQPGVIRLALRVPRESAELVLAELLELAPSGVEEVELPARDGASDIVEYAIYGSPGELPDLPDLQAAVGGVEVEVSTSEVPNDWSERWKQFHRPVLVESPAPSPPGVSSSFRSMSVFVGSLLIRPPWENEIHIPGAEEIVIDPGQAFGTGAHATTHLCLELLLALAASEPAFVASGPARGASGPARGASGPARGAVLDVGAGSGVLAIAAAKLGYGPVLALDNERESVAAIQANAAANNVEVEARRFDLRQEPLPGVVGSPVVLANLLRPLLLDLADSMARLPGPPAQDASPARGGSPAADLRRPRHLIASGLLLEEADEVADAFAEKLSLRERERRQRGEWAALWLTAP